MQGKLKFFTSVEQALFNELQGSYCLKNDHCLSTSVAIAAEKIFLEDSMIQFKRL